MADMLEMRMVDAREAGRAAALAGGERVNPFSSTATAASERVLAIMWGRGYSEGNPVVLEPVE